MKEFKSLAKYESRIGTLFVVVNDEDFEFGKCPLVKSVVLIDGKEVTVRGVEAHALQTIYKGQKIGLLI